MNILPPSYHIYCTVDKNVKYIASFSQEDMDYFYIPLTTMVLAFEEMSRAKSNGGGVFMLRDERMSRRMTLRPQSLGNIFTIDLLGWRERWLVQNVFIMCFCRRDGLLILGNECFENGEREREKSSYEEVKTTLSKTAIILLDFAYAHTRTHAHRVFDQFLTTHRFGDKVRTFWRLR